MVSKTPNILQPVTGFWLSGGNTGDAGLLRFPGVERRIERLCGKSLNVRHPDPLDSIARAPLTPRFPARTCHNVASRVCEDNSWNPSTCRESPKNPAGARTLEGDARL